MAFQSLDTITRFNATSPGTADFVVASAYAAGYKTPSQGAAIDGKVYSYYAQSADGTQWEAGDGTWAAASSTLRRTTVNGTSNGDQNLLQFATVPIVDLFVAAPAYVEQDFASGTIMLFQQATAPNGWTKLTTHNDKALRVVSGTPGTGGVNTFSATFTSRTTDSHTLAVTEIAGHTHVYNGLGSQPSDAPTYSNVTVEAPGATNTGSAGGGGGHTHTYDMRVLYVDVILCQKN
jgi:hypothetical protein